MPRESADPLLVERAGLDNGLTVVRQAAPAAARSFAATYVAPAGWAYDPPGAEGTAFVASEVGPSAAGKRDRVELARALDRLGATLSRHCHPESAEVTVTGPSEAMPALLDLLADVVLRPRFAADDLERVRRQTFERQLREGAQPDERAEREILRSMFPTGHPYRETGIGRHATVARLRPPHLVRFHRDHVTADGSLLVVTGAAGLSDVVRAARGRFRGFSRERAPPPPRIPPPSPRSRDPRTLVMPGRAQVEIRLGGPSLPRSDPEYAGAYLANEVLGGRPLLARLFQQVREKAGLAYHASSELEAMRWGGYWLAQAGTGPERADRALALMRKEIDRLSSTDVPPGELRTIRESAVGELPLALETTIGAHALAVDVAYHDLPATFLREWPATLRRLGPREVRRAAARALDPSRASTIRAGPAAP